MSNTTQKTFLRSLPGILLILFIVGLIVTAGLLVYLLTFNSPESDSVVDRNTLTSEEQTIAPEDTQEETDLEELNSSANSFTPEDLELLRELEEDLQP